MRRFQLGPPRITRRSLIWLIPAGTALAAIAFGGWVVVARAMPAARSVEPALSELRGAAIAPLGVDGAGALDDIRVRLVEVRGDLRPTARLVRLVGRFSAALSWLPLVDHEASVWTAQTDRALGDVETALSLVDASSLLIEIYDGAQDVLSPSMPVAHLDGLKADVAAVRAAYGNAGEALARRRALDGPAALGLRVPGVRTTLDLVGDAEADMALAADLGYRVTDLLGDVVEIGRQVRPLVDSFVVNGHAPEPIDPDVLRASLDETGRYASLAGVKADGIAELVSTARAGDALTLEVERLVELVGVLGRLHRAASLRIQALDPLLEAARASEDGLLGGGPALGEAFDSYAGQRKSVDEAISLLAGAQATLARLTAGSNGRLPARGLSELMTFSLNLETGLRLLNRLAPIGRELFATDSARDYLVLGHSADEIRGTGGFVSSVWLVRFENGKLTKVDYFDSARVDDWERLLLYPKAPGGLEEHMNAWVWLMRDVSWDPDFPTTALAAQDMFRLGQRREVDGVIAINQWTLLKLVESLGSIPDPGGGDPITSRNLLSVLEDGTDTHGRAYMDLTLQGVLDSLTRPLSLGVLTRLASAIYGSLNEKEMMIYLNDPESQSAISLNGWDGRVVYPEADYLYVVDSNVGWNKVDRNVERNTHYRIDLRRLDRPRAALTLEYKNHSGPGATGCLPQWLSRDTSYGNLKNACYWNFIRVYLPEEARLLTTTSLPLPEHSVSVEIGLGVPGEETGGVSSSHGKTVYSGIMSISPGDRSEVTLVYDLPTGVISADGESLTYRLLLQKQPGLRERDVSIRLILPEGYRVASSSHPLLGTDGPEVTLSLRLTRDTLFEVALVQGTHDAR